MGKLSKRGTIRRAAAGAALRVAGQGRVNQGLKIARDFAAQADRSAAMLRDAADRLGDRADKIEQAAETEYAEAERELSRVNREAIADAMKRDAIARAAIARHKAQTGR